MGVVGDMPSSAQFIKFKFNNSIANSKQHVVQIKFWDILCQILHFLALSTRK